MSQRFPSSSPKAPRSLPSPGGTKGSGTPKPAFRRGNPNSSTPSSTKVSLHNSAFSPNKQALLPDSEVTSPSNPSTGGGGSASPSAPAVATPSNKSRTPSKPSATNASQPESCRVREFSTSSNNSVQPSTVGHSGGSGLLTSSFAPLGPQHKSVEEFLDGRGNSDTNEPKTYIQGNCPEIISNGMTELHNKIGEFVVGFENIQSSSNLLLSEWEKTLGDVESYSKKLREMKEMFKCRITQLNSTLKAK